MLSRKYFWGSMRNISEHGARSLSQIMDVADAFENSSRFSVRPSLSIIVSEMH